MKEKGDKSDFVEECRKTMESIFKPNFEAATAAQEKRPLEEQKQEIRLKLQRNGTDVDKNDQDPFGDGDQSPIHGSYAKKQIYRDLFAEGGDIYKHVMDNALSPFALACIYGEVQTVKMILFAADGGLQERNGKPSAFLTELLETRETSMRLSPLLCIVSAGKKLPNVNPDNHVEVARLLLRYGARPDAKDVVGKTICHYGAGIMATKMTMEVVQMCSAAAKACPLYGKEVILHGLKNESQNGKKGIVRGYVTESRRLSVFMYDDGIEKAIKRENLSYIQKEVLEVPKKLCDVPDRLGGVALLEVFMSNRVDVGKFLIDELGADIDVKDNDGFSPRIMAFDHHGQLFSAVGPLVGKAAMKRAKNDLKKQEMNKKEKCYHCGTDQSKDKMQSQMQQCSRCKKATYCSKECQVAHWKAGHKLECKKAVESCIVLEKPALLTSLQCSLDARVYNDAYKRPSYASINQRFKIKIQALKDAQSPLLIYDKSRECQFHLSHNEKGYSILKQKALSEKATNGTKTYMQASFDSEGNCIVYPDETMICTW